MFSFLIDKLDIITAPMCKMGLSVRHLGQFLGQSKFSVEVNHRTRTSCLILLHCHDLSVCKPQDSSNDLFSETSACSNRLQVYHAKAVRKDCACWQNVFLLFYRKCQ